MSSVPRFSMTLSPSSSILTFSNDLSKLKTGWNPFFRFSSVEVAVGCVLTVLLPFADAAYCFESHLWVQPRRADRLGRFRISVSRSILVDGHCFWDQNWGGKTLLRFLQASKIFILMEKPEEFDPPWIYMLSGGWVGGRRRFWGFSQIDTHPLNPQLEAELWAEEVSDLRSQISDSRITDHLRSQIFLKQYSFAESSVGDAA